jgi:c-di-GMP-binding flagellar brake protein YcgR
MAGPEKVVTNPKAESLVSSHSQPAISSYRIQSREEIFQYLQKLYKNHILLSIHIGDSAISFGSIILELDKKGSNLILDELFPRNIISQNVMGKVLTIESKIDGIHCKFSSTVNAIIEEDGSEYTNLSIPHYMYYFQRREYFRARNSLSKPIQVELLPEKGVKVEAEIQDLSIGGLSARLDGASHQFISEDIYPRCIIIFPDGEKIESSIEILRSQLVGHQDQFILAGKFNELEKKNRELLSKEIAKLERENIKLVKRV